MFVELTGAITNSSYDEKITLGFFDGGRSIGS